MKTLDWIVFYIPNYLHGVSDKYNIYKKKEFSINIEEIY